MIVYNFKSFAKLSEMIAIKGSLSIYIVINIKIGYKVRFTLNKLIVSFLINL